VNRRRNQSSGLKEAVSGRTWRGRVTHRRSAEDFRQDCSVRPGEPIGFVRKGEYYNFDVTITYIR
jgi:hypothetical protein